MAPRPFATVVVTWVAVCAAACDPPPARMQGAEPLYSCYESDYDYPQLFVIADAERWRAVWRDVGACGGPKPPPVDFARRTALVVGFGYVGSGGYAFTIDSVVPGPGATTVHATRSEPGGEECSESAVVTHPVSVILVPRRASPYQLTIHTVARPDC